MGLDLCPHLFVCAAWPEIVSTRPPFRPDLNPREKKKLRELLKTDNPPIGRKYAGPHKNVHGLPEKSSDLIVTHGKQKKNEIPIGDTIKVNQEQVEEFFLDVWLVIRLVRLITEFQGG